MILQSARCSSKHTENMSITPSQKACLSVSRRRQCPIERGNSLLKQWQNTSVKATIERCNSLWKHVKDETLNRHRLGLFWTDREQIFADFQAEIKKHEFQADSNRRSFQKLTETIESQQEELHRAQAHELHRRDQQLLHEQLLKKN